MKLKSRVGPKGQAVIPKEVRDVLGISPGDDVVFEVTGDAARIEPSRGRSSVSEFTEVVRREDKLVDDVDVKKFILAEHLE